MRLVEVIVDRYDTYMKCNSFQKWCIRRLVNVKEIMHGIKPGSSMRVAAALWHNRQP